MAQYKTSSYNHEITVGDGVVLYNFLTKALLEVPADSRDAIQALLHDTNVDCSVQNDLFLLLLSQGFIVRSDINELDPIKYKYFSALFGGRTQFTLAILPTLWCNLRCSYCFESRRHEFMQPETQKKLVEFVDYKLTDVKELGVSWFGGEPLLCKTSIENLTREFQRICATHHCGYEASITTNGYLLNVDFMKSLEGLGVRSLQITFDGPPKHHDTYRALPNGTGTFAVIHKNVEDLCRVTADDLQLLLRVNCTEDNFKDIPELLTLFSDTVKRRSKIFFRWIYPNEASGYKDFVCGIPKHSRFTLLANVSRKAMELGWSVDDPLEATPIYCEVDTTNFYQVSPNGDVFLCSDSCKPDEALGNVREWRKLLAHPSFKWYAANPFDDPDCLKCILLPYCMGGCRRARVSGHKACIDEVNDLDSLVSFFYHNVLKQQGAT